MICFNIDPYQFKVIIARSANDITNLGLDKKFWLLDGAAKHCVIPLHVDKGAILCWGAFDQVDMSELVHECEHLKQFLLEMNDVNKLIFDWNSSQPEIRRGEKEFHAYLIQNIFATVLRHL